MYSKPRSRCTAARASSQDKSCMSQTGGYRVERMPPSGVTLAIDWAALEGWNPGLNDAACFYAIDPDGFLQGVLDGKTIATVSAPIYDGNFAFVGLYIVEPEYRGKGYGIQLTKAMLEHIGERNAALDGVEAMAEKYARLGFRTAHRSVRHSFTPKQKQNVAVEIVPLGEVPFSELAAYDRRHFFASRENFLKVWINQPHAITFGFVDGGTL